MLKSELTDHQIVAAMRQYGGGFVSLLGNLFLNADSDNQARIKTCWPEYWKRYADIAERLRCPDCGQSNILRRHHFGTTGGVPECDFKECEDCGRQFDHQ